MENNAISKKIMGLLLDESNYFNELEKASKFIQPFKREFTFNGVDGCLVYAQACIVANPKATVVICTGFTDHVTAYEEMNYYFTSFGYSTFIIENRGNGRSGRLGIDDYQVSIDTYEDYIADFHMFIENIVKPNCGESDLYALGHSMGGLIVTRYIEEYPDTFKKVILSSPMFEVQCALIPKDIARYVSKKNSTNGKYALANRPNDDNTLFGSSRYDSPVRHEGLTIKPKELNPAIRSGGASYKWVHESYEAIDKVFLKENIDKIDVPILLCQAQKDYAVKNSGQKRFLKATKTCEMKIFKKAAHELFKAPNEILKEYLYEIFTFYDNKAN